MRKRLKFKDPMKEYQKPSELEIKISGAPEFPIFEQVLHTMFDTLGFKRFDGEEGSDYVIYKYRPKYMRSK